MVGKQWIKLESVTKKSLVTLFYRKPRAAGNYSLETSFDVMMAAFPADAPFSLRRQVLSHFSNGIVARILATLEARRLRSDINHITGDVHFIALGLPRRSTILTIHDCGFMNDYQGAYRWFLWLFWLLLPVWWCKKITTISLASKADILRYTRCAAHKIRVIPTLIARHFYAVPKIFEAQKPRILHIGLAPNKNLINHLKALQGLNCSLYIIGKMEAEHHTLLQQYQLEYDWGYNLSEAQIQDTYAQCDLLLFASTLEGFGMPILEAQTVGRPVVTSNLSSMPEVAGSAACLVDPHSVDSIRAGILRVIEDAAYREHLVAAGFENVKRFQAETVAQAYAELYGEVKSEK